MVNKLSYADKGKYPHASADNGAIPLDVLQPIALTTISIPSTDTVAIANPDFVLTSDIDCIVSLNGFYPTRLDGIIQPLQVFIWAGERTVLRSPVDASAFAVAPLNLAETGLLIVQYIEPWLALGSTVNIR